MSCSDDNPLFDATKDIDFLEQVEAERINLTGAPLQYYVLNRGKNVDPLYNEPDAWGFEDNSPFSFKGWFKFVEDENREEMVSEYGYESEYEAELIIATLTWRTEVEANIAVARGPRSGDVVVIASAVHPSRTPLSFDVVKAGAGGVVYNSTQFVSYRLLLHKKTKFIPGRKLTA